MATHSPAAVVLLNALPETQRLVVAEHLADALKTKFDIVSASLAVQILSQHPRPEAFDQIVDSLFTRVELGHFDDVESITDQSTTLAERLLGRIVQRLIELTRELQRESQLAQDGFAEKLPSLDQNERPGNGTSTVVPLLLFAGRLALARPAHQDLPTLVDQALVLMGANDRVIALAARDVVFTSLGSQSHPRLEGSRILQCSRSLLALKTSRLHRSLGYSLWLRLLLSSHLSSVGDLRLETHDYWQTIREGLRQGDGECRKLCLEILKQSVRIAVGAGRVDLVSNEKDAPAATITYQFNRFCTVFETIVLARYANLVVECEADLKLLCSSRSVIGPQWLLVLLSTALDPKLQDQNRRFIGDWILRNSLAGRVSPQEYAGLIAHDLLSWLAEGHFFVSSLQRTEGGFRCKHGERLSAFTARMVQEHSRDASDLHLFLNTFINFLIQKRTKLFKYAAVYILEGLVNACRHIEALCLGPSQLEHVLEISTWQALPEVAGHLVLDRCWKICAISVSRSSAPIRDFLAVVAQDRYDMLREAMGKIDASGTRFIAPILERSRRAALVEQTTQKFLDLQSTLSSAASMKSEIISITEDIWSDVEYLVFPRELLMLVPETFFHSNVIEMTLDENKGGAALRSLLASTLFRMLELTEKRSFLLSPLACTIRRNAFVTPESARPLPIEDFVLQVARTPPESSLDLRFEYAALTLLCESAGLRNASLNGRYFGKGESNGFAAYLDLVSRLHGHQSTVRSIVDSILARWKRQKVPAPSIAPWKTTLQLQVLLLCCEQLANFAPLPDVEQVNEDLLYILSVEPLPRYRYLLEWTVLRLHVHHPTLRGRLLQLMDTKDHHSNPKYLASLMKVGVSLALVEDTSEEFAVQLAAAFIALSASSKVVIRHEAQWSFPLLMDTANARDWKQITENPAYVALDAYIRSLPRFDDPPVERVLSRFHPVDDHTLTHLAEGPWTDLDSTRPPFARREDFISVYKDDEDGSSGNLPRSCMPLGDGIPRRLKAGPPTEGPEQVRVLVEPEQFTPEEAVALQTKGTAYLKNVLQDAGSRRAHQSQLLVVASLVDNPYNLGGLSRVSEIFGARTLYVRDPRVVADKDFTSVAVSSHHHIDISPLAPPDMPAFLASKKREGWSVVGVEQTDRSVVIGAAEAVLPRKTILVLGSEREGLPGVTLSECDVLVEIPQQGVTRSLNVQTAAAIALYEYCRQHRG